MDDLNVSVIRLEPIRVASFFGFGTEPETEAWSRLIEWAQPLGLLDHPDQHRIFGFNHPEPAPGSPNYGYELWLTVDPNYESQGKVELKEFPGGLYAVARCEVNGNPYEAIPAAWQSLVQWREQSRFTSSHRQWLEAFVETSRMVEGFFTLDLYLPLAE